MKNDLQAWSPLILDTKPPGGNRLSASPEIQIYRFGLNVDYMYFFFSRWLLKKITMLKEILKTNLEKIRKNTAKSNTRF